MEILAALSGWAILAYILLLFGIISPKWAIGLWLGLAIFTFFAKAYVDAEEEEEKNLKQCKMCAEKIQKDALKCKHCGEMQSG